MPHGSYVIQFNRNLSRSLCLQNNIKESIERHAVIATQAGPVLMWSAFTRVFPPPWASAQNWTLHIVPAEFRG